MSIGDLLVRLRVHEGADRAFGVEELQALPVGLDVLHRLLGPEAALALLPGLEVPELGVHHPAHLALAAVVVGRENAAEGPVAAGHHRRTHVAAVDPEQQMAGEVARVQRGGRVVVEHHQVRGPAPVEGAEGQTEEGGGQPVAASRARRATP